MRRSRVVLVLVLVIAIAVALAWALRFGTDDSWISYVYARALVRGDGLTWFGTHVEGYTNFLWVMWVALGLRLGGDPLVWSWVGSLAALAVVLAVAFRWARMHLPSEVGAVGVVALLATNFTFLAFGTSGLETMLQTALLAVVMWQADAIRRDGQGGPLRLALVSTVAALAVATRLDSAVVCSIAAIALAHHLHAVRAPLRLWASAVVPAFVLVGSWLAWKLAYYGDLVPNTAHAKLGFSLATLQQGAIHLGRFLHAYWLWPAILIVAIAMVAKRRRPPILPLAVVLAWSAYVIAVGGDFMEFRFFVPMMPALFVLVGQLPALVAASRVPRETVRAGALVAVLATVSARHASQFTGISKDLTYDSVRSLGTYYGKVPDGDWSALGRPFSRVFAGTNAILACQGAGAIPYFADLPTVDQLGLNDAWVARHGVSADPSFRRPGHQRFAPYEYLIERRVNFVIGAPTLIPRGRLHAVSPRHLWSWIHTSLTPDGSTKTRVGDVTIVAVPVSKQRALLAWYLTKDPEITGRVVAAGWESRDLRSR